MAYTSTFHTCRRIVLVGLVLASICALSQQEVRAQAELTIIVQVRDEANHTVPTGEVRIKRPLGNTNVGKLENGVASVSGKFLIKPDYEVKVTADNYQQVLPPPRIPESLLQAAANGDKKVSLPNMISMVRKGGTANANQNGNSNSDSQSDSEQARYLAELQRQFSEHLPENPTLLDATLRQVDTKPELQTRLLGLLRERQGSWMTLGGVQPLPKYVWLLPLLGFVAGVLAQVFWNRRAAVALESSDAPAADLETKSQGQGTEDPAQSSDANPEHKPKETKIDKLMSKVEQLKEQQDTLCALLDKTLHQQTCSADNISPGGGIAGGSAVIQRGAGSNERDAPASLNATTPATNGQPNDFNERAKLYYRSLVREGQSSPAPQYLNAEMKSSPLDMIGDKEVFLLEVTHMQGAFVLYADVSDRGLVFPNPQLNFSQPALRPLFPQLTAQEFNSSKETIVPVPVTRVGEDRWKVERKP